MLDLGKGDPPGASATARDIQREKAIDAQLKDPPRLPTYLQKYERRASRVDADVCHINLFVSAT
jgi:cell cycle checkpoint protein